MLEYFRGLSQIADIEVLEKIDYYYDDTGLPKSNVLLFKLKGGLQVIIRPSGTEPLLKLYIDIACEQSSDGALVMSNFKQALLEMVKEAEKEM